MKKQFITSVLFILLGTALFSQVKVRPGIRLAMNVSDISGLDTDVKAGANFSVFANMHFSDFYEFQIEGSFSDQGAIIKYIDEETLESKEVEESIRYISLGLINKLYIENTGVHFIVGPSFDFAPNNDSFGFLFPSIDIALTGGLGYEFPFGLSIEGRYKQGFVDLGNGLNHYEDNYYTQESEDVYFNSVFQLGLSYKFGF